MQPRLSPVPLLALLAACAIRGSGAEVTTPEPSGPLWSAVLMPRSHAGAPIGGSASMAGVSGRESQTVAVISLDGASPDAPLSWEVRAGDCSSTGPLLGPTAVYPVLRPRVDRTANATATLPVEPPRDGLYSVRVHASPDRRGALVACGDLRRTDPETGAER
ncbi:MAG TPA: hypothetical protein VFY16_05055 [Gemmatimonadaceae bacterium]|nr:hypothetical protein [Gemmatimonadaceae bacterium]